MRLEVLNIDGTSTGRSVDLSDDCFGIEPNDHLIYLAVKYYMANQRQGTHKAKERGEITGSRKKLKKQKGTGTARFGDIKNPLFRGGGRVFGPRPRTYSSKMNKKEMRLARMSALSYKAKENKIIVVEDFNFDEPQTKKYKAMLKNLGVADKRTLFVAEQPDKNVRLSARNIQKAEVMRASDINTYQILKAGCLLINESAVKAINNQPAN